MRVTDIIIDPEISQIFKMQENIRYEIFQKIKNHGFDKSRPLTVQKGTNILLDGHTRLNAAKEAGLEEVPVVEMDFDDRSAAVTYSIESQTVRRNLSGPELLKAVEMLPYHRSKKGEGRMAKQLADQMGIGQSTVYNSLKILKEAPPEILQKVKNGEMSIKKGAAALRNVNKPEDKMITADAIKLPPTAKFLKGAVVLLIEAGQESAAMILIKHFLNKDERDKFTLLLPESVNERLNSLFATLE
jgi:ParB family chromosome partitioning protein